MQHKAIYVITFSLLGLSVSGLARSLPLPKFPAGAVWHQDVSNASLHPNSASMIDTLARLGSANAQPNCGFGFCRMQIDFSMRVLYADNNSPLLPLAAHLDYGYYAPDCDALGTNVPLPVGGAIEDPAVGYDCDNTEEDNTPGNDCHMLVVNGNELYELYSTDRNNAQTQMNSLCLAKWDLSRIYPAEGRGEHCTSADAAGFPIAPLLFNADEIFNAMQVSNGDLGHAIRFILPNARMASDPPPTPMDDPIRYYVRPASHAGGPSGPSGSIAYGSRLILRNNFPLTGYNAAAQVVLRTLKKFGMVLADGGNIALTAESDEFTTHKWNEPGIDFQSNEFFASAGALKVNVVDFSVVDTGPRIIETYECVPNVLPTGVIFSNGFE